MPYEAAIYYYDIIPGALLDQPFTYRFDAFLEPGQLVIIPLRNRMVLGVVLKQNEEFSEVAEEGNKIEFKVKDIAHVLAYKYSVGYLNFITRASQHSMIPVGYLFDMGVLSLKSFEMDDEMSVLQPYQFNHTVLNDEQFNAFQSIQQTTGFKTFVLDGVTGSGKTEVYFQAANEVLKMNKKIIILLPEISLTEAIVKRFTQAFGREPFIWHSNVTPAKKRKAWKALMQEGPAVILGARSALFLPLTDLGLIVVDEEHDSSYKQEEQGVYNARDFAVLRGYFELFPVVLVSATPSLETWLHAKSGRYQSLVLPNRFADARMPEVQIVDKKQFPGVMFTPPLLEEMKRRLADNEQTLLFLNRRGYSPLLLCVSCGYRFECPGCHVGLTVHRETQNALCHYCGYAIEEPKECPSCNNENIKEIGWGVEKVAQEIQKIFPTARILCVSSDKMLNSIESQDIFRQIENRDVDIIVGTQILAKGHHFPHLTCVGVLDADRGLSQLDLRAGEKTFQLLSQVSGRAGRMVHHNGVVLLQTYDPESPLYRALQAHDRNMYYDIELSEREAADMPPFSRLIAITVSSLREDLLMTECRQLSRVIPVVDGVMIVGPTPAPLYRIRSRYRMRFLVHGPKHKNLQGLIKSWLSSKKINPHVQLHIDVDPLSFL